MTYASNPAYTMQGAKNAKRAARQMGKPRRGHNHESHGSRYDWGWRPRNEAPGEAVSRPDLIAEYNARLGA